MKTLQIELPDALAAKLAELVEEGWFASEAEAAALALTDFIRRRPFELQEQFQREDIAWALGQRDGEEAPADPSGERDRFVEAVEEGLADAEAGRVISDEELGASLDEEFGPLDTGHLKTRLRKDRPMTTVNLRMPEDVVDDLRRIASRLGFTSYQALVRALVGQSLRRRMDRHDKVDESESHGDAATIPLAPLDYRLLQGLANLATGREGQEREVQDLLRRYLGSEISLAKMADTLKVSRFELQESFGRLGVPIRLGPATLEEARAEVKVARDLE